MGKWSNVARIFGKIANTSPRGYYTSGRHGFGRFREYAKDIPYMRFRYTPSVVSRGWRYARNLNDYYRIGRDLHVARAMESPWKLSMYVFKIVRRVAPWALSSGYLVNRLVNWSPLQKKYFIYCVEQAIRDGKKLSPKALYECIRKTEVQTRKTKQKSLRNGSYYYRGRYGKSKHYPYRNRGRF